ncbi:hypothetical protein KI387_002276, partial [Taxus chinensis]
MGKGSVKGESVSDNVLKKVLLSYTYVAIWIFLSFTVIVFNKYILDKKMYNWPFPITLTMIHMAFCSALAVLLVRVLKLVEPIGMTKEVYLSSIVPIGALYSMSLWFSNSAYIYLSVSFIQMLKALMPVAVYSIGVGLKKENFKSNTMANMIGISVGVAIAAYGEAKFNTWGVMLQLGAVGFEATSFSPDRKDFSFDNECCRCCEGLAAVVKARKPKPQLDVEDINSQESIKKKKKLKTQMSILLFLLNQAEPVDLEKGRVGNAEFPTKLNSLDKQQNFPGCEDLRNGVNRMLDDIEEGEVI